MSHRPFFSRLPRPARRTRVLVAVLVVTQSPLSAVAARASEPAAALAVASPSPWLSAATTVWPSSTLPAPTVNRTVPTVTPPPTQLTFSGLPTDTEIFSARIFSEPLMPIGGATRPIENIRLAQALRIYAGAKRPEEVAPITRFLDEHGDSPWRASLLVNVGEVYDRTGYARRALDAWNEAWTLTKSATDVHGRAVADRALAEWLTLTFGRGDVAATRQRLRETASREIGGSAETRVRNIRERLSIVTHQRHLLVPAEQQALARLAAYERKATRHSVTTNNLSAHASRLIAKRGERQPTSTRRSWASALRRAVRLGLSLRPGVRTTRGRFVPRSLVHLKTGHAVAILDAQADRLLVYDPLRGDDRWIAAAALEADASGAALIAAGPLPDGWEAASATAAVFLTQMCPPGPPNDNDPPPCNCAGGAAGVAGGGGAGPSGGGSPEPGGGGEPSSECGTGPCETADNALARYRLHRLTAGLLVEDTPVGHKPPRGPAVFFHVRYNQRAGFFPQVLSFSNLGSKWTHDWLSYVEDLPVSCGGGGAGGNCIPAHARVVLRGGGTERHIPSGPTTYYRHWRSASELVQTSNAPLRFERRLRDGSVEVFAQWDGVPAGQGARVFMTEIIDPRGQSAQLTYDSQFRLVSITDTLGQVTMLAYELATDPLKITKVTDPFGRFATFTYTATGQLASITDVIGLTSSFLYAGDFLSRLTTPYGATTFRKETDWQNDAFVRHIEAIDPLGGIERVEYRTELTTLPDSVPSSEVPTGFTEFNAALDQFVSLYWNKRAMKLAPRDPASAVVTSWLTENIFNHQWLGVDVPRFVKWPLEARVWYAYPGQDPGDGEVGSWIRPAFVARALDDGTSQIWQTTFNDHGKVTSHTDPLGRRTSYTYAANGIDLLIVRQTTATLDDLLATYSNYNVQHLPQSLTDAAGQTTSFTYNAHGQILTLTNAKNETRLYQYDSGGQGYLQVVTGPVAGSTKTFAYDSYGRLRTVTEADGYSVQADYDAIGRITKRTYPDTSYEAYVYDKLDLVEVRDRLGRKTRRVHDPMRRLLAMTDPLGRTITQEWCGCGTLDALIDAKGSKTRWERDLRGRVIREIQADGTTETVFTYETQGGRLKQITDPKEQQMVITYALDDRLQQVTHNQAVVPTPSVTYTYDAAYGRVATRGDGTGTTVYSYKTPGSLGAGALASIDGPLANDTVLYDYDELGRISTRSTPGGATTRTYDGLGRITAETTAVGTFTYTFDGLMSRVQSVTFPNSQVTTYTYDDNEGDHKLLTVDHRRPGGALLAKFDYTYDAVGKVMTVEERFGEAPASAWTYAYDAADQLLAATKQTVGATPTVLAYHTYTYDPAGNLVSEQRNDTVVTRTYDVLNRLASESAGGLLRVVGSTNEPAAVTVQGQVATPLDGSQFHTLIPIVTGAHQFAIQAMDASGNIATSTYQVNTAGASRSFAYDQNGNLTSDGVRTFTWDARNRLVMVLSSGVNLEFAYDGLGRRTSRTLNGNTSTYLYADEDVVREVSNTGTTDYIHGIGIDRPIATKLADESIQFFVADRLGSVVATTSAVGAPLSTRVFDPFGRQAMATEGYAFTAREWDDAAKLYYYRARYYDPDLKRFASPDPLPPTQRMYRELNAYSYVINNPVNLSDPSGLKVQECCAKAEILFGLVSHCWLKTSKHEAGLGVEGQVTCRDAAMPGDRGGGGIWTQVSDHSACSYRNPVCRDLPGQVSESCVDQYIRTGSSGLGIKMGPWHPILNDCWAFVSKVTVACWVSDHVWMLQ